MLYPYANIFFNFNSQVKWHGIVQELEMDSAFRFGRPEFIRGDVDLVSVHGSASSRAADNEKIAIWQLFDRRIPSIHLHDAGGIFMPFATVIVARIEVSDGLPTWVRLPSAAYTLAAASADKCTVGKETAARTERVGFQGQRAVFIRIQVIEYRECALSGIELCLVPLGCFYMAS